MAKCLLAGDWHGNMRWVNSVFEWADERDIRTIYQAGDFGFWPGATGMLYLNAVTQLCEKYKITLWVTPGNHEDYTQIHDPETTDGYVPERQVVAEGEGWEFAILPRGYRWEFGGLQFLSFGGAPSIDFENRREGVSWWPEEMIRESDLLRLPFSGEREVDVMICHDAPDGGTPRVQAIIDTPADQSMWTQAGLDYAKQGREIMNKAVEIVKPRSFVHGHFHAPDLFYNKDQDCTYLSLGMDGEDANVVIFSTEEFVRNDKPKGEVESSE
jgi:hypothetical protein